MSQGYCNYPCMDDCSYPCTDYGNSHEHTWLACVSFMKAQYERMTIIFALCLCQHIILSCIVKLARPKPEAIGGQFPGQGRFRAKPILIFQLSSKSLAILDFNRPNSWPTKTNGKNTCLGKTYRISQRTRAQHKMKTKGCENLHKTTKRGERIEKRKIIYTWECPIYLLSRSFRIHTVF